jgi:cell division protein FtsB
MLKKFFIFLAVLLVIALVLCWIYLPSVTRYRELRSEEERLKLKIREIDQQIKMLADERNLLQTDVAYLEKVIREELGFVKPGEIIYEFVTKTDAFGPADASSETSVTYGSIKTSVTTSATAKKASISSAAAVASAANATSKIPTKKTASS